MRGVYAGVIATLLATFKAMAWDVRVRGAEHVPATGGGVVATNHIGYLDFVFAGYGVREQSKRRLRFVAKREVFDHPVSGPLMRGMGHVPVDRSGDTSVALAEVARNLDAGELVGMFPEGTISRSFVPMAGRSGAVRMAMGAGVPLVPGAVWGTQRIYTKGRKPSPTRGAVILIGFGPPVGYEPDEDPLDVHTRLMAAIGELVGELAADYPQEPRDAADGWWVPAHLGGSAPAPAQVEAGAQAARRHDGAG